MVKREKPLSIKISMVCANTFKAIAEVEENFSQRDWYSLSYLERVRITAHTIIKMADVSLTPRQVHAKWRLEKINDGWKLGAHHSQTDKTIPNLVGWDKLDKVERFKYKIHSAITETFLSNGNKS